MYKQLYSTIIKQNNIIIIGKKTCYYYLKSINFCNEKGIFYTKYDFDDDYYDLLPIINNYFGINHTTSPFIIVSNGDLDLEMIKKNIKTNIEIKYIGGCDKFIEFINST